MGNKDITDFNEAQLRKRAASKEELNICLTNNYAFQKIFKNEEIVKGFLIALLHLKETDIEELEVTDPFVEGEVKEEKEGILDVKLILNGGKKINIEMQNTYQEDWAERSLFYNCRMFTEGLKTGQSYSSKFQFHVIELSKIETTKGNHYMEKARDEMIKMSRDESER